MTPDYYRMAEDEDLFAWTKRLPIPAWLADHITAPGVNNMLEIVCLWFIGFRYARRCLWKGTSAASCATDAEKAAEFFLRLAQVLRRDD